MQNRPPRKQKADMESFLILVSWMALGAFSALRFGPAGSWPVAIVLGPLWLPIAAELRTSSTASDQDVMQRLQHLGFVQEGDG